MSQTLRSLHRLYLSQYLAELQPTCIVHRSKRLTLIDDFDGPYLACELQHRCCGVTLGFPREGTLCFVCNTGPTLPTTDIHAMIGLNPICESCEEIDFLVELWAATFWAENLRSLHSPCPCCSFKVGAAPKLFLHESLTFEDQFRNSHLESLIGLSNDLAIVKRSKALPS